MRLWSPPRWGKPERECRSLTAPGNQDKEPEVPSDRENQHRTYEDRPGTGKAWRAHSVACGRYQYRLPHCAKGHDWLTLTHAAQQLGVSATVVKRCLAHGTLPARQVVPQAPWSIQRTDLALPAVQAAVQGEHIGRRPPGFRPGPASTPAGAAPAATAPAETRSPKLVSGVQ